MTQPDHPLPDINDPRVKEALGRIRVSGLRAMYAPQIAAVTPHLSDEDSCDWAYRVVCLAEVLAEAVVEQERVEAEAADTLKAGT